MEDSLTDLFRQIIETQHMLRRELNSVEGSLRSLILTSAQTNAELTLQRRSIDQMHGKVARLAPPPDNGPRRPDSTAMLFGLDEKGKDPEDRK